MKQGMHNTCIGVFLGLLVAMLPACGGGGGGGGTAPGVPGGVSDGGGSVAPPIDSGGSIDGGGVVEGGDVADNGGVGGGEIVDGDTPGAGDAGEAPAPAIITGGIAVDPYIVGATFFEDVNGNGFRDDGEQISLPTDENGRFIFASPIDPASGSSIVMYDRGTHLGIPFTGKLLHKITADDPEEVVVSPLTTLKALGVLPADIVASLNTLNNDSGVTSYNDKLDPVAAATAANTDADLAELRANLYLGAVLDLYMANKDLTAITRQDLLNVLDNWAPGAALMEGLQYAVRLESVNAITLPDNPDLPPVTMREVVESMPAILDWWKQEALSREIQGVVPMELSEFMDRFQTTLAELGLKYYVRNNFNLPAVQSALETGALPSFNPNERLCLKEIGTSKTLEEAKFKQSAIAGNDFAIGRSGVLEFSAVNSATGYDIGGTVDLTPSNGSKIGGIWYITNGILVLKETVNSDEDIRLELASEWSSHVVARLASGGGASYKSTFLKTLLDETESIISMDVN